MQPDARVVVIAGPSGSGKSLVGGALAARLGWNFADADDFHTPEAKLWMNQGHPLTDAMRGPWLARLARRIESAVDSGHPLVLACSALKRMHRGALRKNMPGPALRFFWLDAPAEELRRRLNARKGHFFNPCLLPSQLEAAEPPTPGDGLIIDGTLPREEIVGIIVEALSSDPCT